jgi:hypothetical protein
MKNDEHYLGAIRQKLEQLYEEHPDDPRLREQIADEVDWIDAQIAELALKTAQRRDRRWAEGGEISE